MNRACCCVLLTALPLFVGCNLAAQTPQTATMTLAMRGEGGWLIRPHNQGNYTAGASLALGTTNCCGFGTYVSYSKLHLDAALEVDDPGHDEKYVDKILDGGVELYAILPWHEAIEVAVRGGIAGTPPTNLSSGRNGFSGGVRAAYRFTRINRAGPDVGEFAPTFAATVGVVMWSLGARMGSAGPDTSSSSGAAIMVGIQVGADYGINFQ